MKAKTQRVKTKTKIFWGIVLTFLLAATVASGMSFFGIGGLVYLGAQTAFTAFIGSSLLFAGSLIFTSSAVTTGHFRRRRAEKIQGKEIANMVRIAQNSTKAEAVDTQQLSNKLTKSMFYSASSNQSGLIGQRNSSNKGDESNMITNKLEAISARSYYINSSPRASINKSKRYSKKVRMLKAECAKANFKGASSEGAFSYTAEVVDPYNNAVYRDYRNEISCFTEKTKKDFTSMILADKSRVDKKYVGDFGYETRLIFGAGKSDIKFNTTHVRCNAETNMEAYECMLLKDVKSYIDSNDGNVKGIFPISLKRSHFTSHKHGKENTITIKNYDALVERICSLMAYTSKNPNYKASGSFIGRKYTQVKSNSVEM